MDNVINLFGNRSKKEEEPKTEEEMSFEEIMKKNEENKKRLEKERAKANKSVTRSYRLKK
jgi:hypothetical protein